MRPAENVALPTKSTRAPPSLHEFGLLLLLGPGPDPAIRSQFGSCTSVVSTEEAESFLKRAENPVIAVVSEAKYEAASKMLESSGIVAGVIILACKDKTCPTTTKKAVTVTTNLDPQGKLCEFLIQVYSNYVRFQRFFEDRTEKSFYGLDDRELIISSLRMRSRTDEFTIFYPLGTRAVNLRGVLSEKVLRRIEEVATKETSGDVKKRAVDVANTARYLREEKELGMKEVIRSYTMAGLYFMLNLYLRYGKTEGLELFKEYMFCLKGSMCELGTPITEKGTMVYRGLKWDHKFLEEYEKKKGEFVLLNGFVSTSLNRDVAVTFANNGGSGGESTLLEIRLVECDEGYVRFIKGFGFPEENGVLFPVNISEFSVYNSEQEVLFPPFYPMKIVDVGSETVAGRTYSKIVAETPNCVNISGKNQLNNMLKAQSSDVDWKRQYIDSMLRLSERRIIDKLSLVNLDFLSYDTVFSRIVTLVKGGECRQLMIEYEALLPDHVGRMIDDCGKTLGSLRILSLNNTKIGSLGVQLIAGVLKTNSALEALELSKNKLDRPAFKSIAEMLTANSTLTSLRLMRTGMAPEDVGPFGKALNENKMLAVLDISYNGLNRVGLVELATALAKNDSLLALDAAYNDAPQVVVCKFKFLLHENKALVAINVMQDLNDATTQTEGLQEITGLNSLLLIQRCTNTETRSRIPEPRRRAIVDILNPEFDCKALGLKKYSGLLFKSFGRAAEILAENMTVISLDARKALISTDPATKVKTNHVSALVTAIANNRTVTTLILAENDMMDTDAVTFAKGLATDRTLTSLDLSSCALSSEAAVQILGSLGTGSVLKKLNLSHNKINSKVGDAISAAITASKSLTVLDVSYNDLGDKTVSGIGTALHHNTVLTTLKIDSTGAATESLVSLASALTANRMLRKLFISGINASVPEEAFARLCTALGENTSVVSVRLDPEVSPKRAEMLRDLFKKSKTLTTLRLEGNAGNLNLVATIQEVAIANSLALKSLKLVGIKLSKETGEMLGAVLSRPTSLVRLCLHKVSLDAETIKPIASALGTNKTLTSLCFRGTKVDMNIMKLLSAAFRRNTSVTYLSFRSCGWGLDEATIFVFSLRTNRTLKTLVMDENNNGLFATLSLLYLCGALMRNDVLTTLYIDAFLDPFFRSLLQASMNANRTLVRVVTTDGINHFQTYRGAAEERRQAQQRVRAIGIIETSLKNHDNHTLTVNNCFLDSDSLRALAEALKADTFIDTLELVNNVNHGDECAILIADVIKANKKITTVKYSGNGCTSAAARTFAGLLRENTTLKSLWLGPDNFGDEGAKLLADALANNTGLESLTMTICNLGDLCIPPFVEALKVNKTLKTLDLKNNTIGDEGAKRLAEGLKATPGRAVESIILQLNQVGRAGTEALKGVRQKVDLDDNYDD